MMRESWKYSLFVLFALAGLLYSCGGDKGDNQEGDKPSKDTLMSKIKEMEDSLKNLQANINEVKQVPNLTRIEYINRLLEFYHAYPEDELAAECLDKVHMVYSGMNVHIRAIQYADTLLQKYPNYINRAMVIESQGASYDIFLQPRDSVKVRYYYEMLLKENPKMDKEKRKGIQERLKYNHLTFEEYIDKQMEAITKK